MTFFVLQRPFLLFAACTLASGCASTGGPGLTIDYDDPKPAEVAVEPKAEAEIVTLTEPLPLPGQLKPAPVSKEPQASALSPLEQAGEANMQARFEPEQDGYINAIHVYPYVPGALYRLYASPEQVSEIALETGETLTSVSAGDTVRWILGDTTSGSGAAARVHILVKPMRTGLETNLIIATNRRIYHLELEATPGTYMASVSWHYPQNDLARASARKAMDLAPDAGVGIENLRFRYTISGDDAPWVPLRAFDDGRKVYIQFPARLDQGEAPPLFALDARGKQQLVNYRMRGTYYIVDRLFAAAELRFGEKPQQVVRIIRTDAR
ncbi:P-type conjugative transfer protein TrbG [Erythrobacter aureus]|uniref:P-type conjugative transfer protein TrbG n=1 Tax=Erythrobacter aureus TaxID=2182384 RepID=UPI003A921E38